MLQLSTLLAPLYPTALRAAATLLALLVLPAVSVSPALAVEALPPDASPTAVEDAAHLGRITVRGKQSRVRRMHRSAEPVSVVETKTARAEAADLGEVLARTQGVSVRRDGGLGSPARFSMGGLYDDQIRLFLDGVPLDTAGYPFGISNVPVNLIDSVEVYRGVVPIRLGADALGGAVNLVSDQRYRTSASASYQVGSFGTHRMTAHGRWRHDRTGLVTSAAVFVDRADNDYHVNVEVPDELGRPHAARVPRFHDAYAAQGVLAEVGVVDRSWARRLTLQAFASSYTKDLQHNAVMTLPYGEVTYGEAVYGATARWDVRLPHHLDVEFVANHARRTIDFDDQSQWVYNWRGERVRERQVAGELGRASDLTIWQDSSFGRLTASWRPLREHTVRASVTPQFAVRTGNERLQLDPTAPDPWAARRQLFTLVTGVEYEANLLDEKLQNILFVKDYLYQSDSEERTAAGTLRARRTDRHSQGMGDALRLQLADWLWLKASWEYATRLPRPDEVFGNGVLTLANLELQPEVSHNANFGPHVELAHPRWGDLLLDLNGFLRDADRLIVLIGNDKTQVNQNLYSARSVGVETAIGWRHPSDLLSLDATATWQEQRNTPKRGAFASFEGDRIPNRPWLFASWGARSRWRVLPRLQGLVEPYYRGRYVHAFYRGWESQGLKQYKQGVDAQTTHGVGVTLLARMGGLRWSATLEVDNLSDAQVFDNFGVQRPGRSFHFKLAAAL